MHNNPLINVVFQVPLTFFCDINAIANYFVCGVKTQFEVPNTDTTGLNGIKF